MAKTNIVFNNKNYSIDESSLSTATAALRTHLSTTMSGSGATINFAGVPYNIDQTKLSAATNDFTSHLATIAGSGHKVMVNGVEYGIDSAKVQGAISELEATFSGTGEERLEGDGAEYYTLAPTALSFRSTAPLNELQEVQINGVTVDPSNYTLEEGSTIVTFPIDYLKTLNVGNYEVAVASDSKTVKGGFTVAAPELNEYGFYYNQPYVGYVSYYDQNWALFMQENGKIDIFSISNGGIENGTYVYNENGISVTTPYLGTATATVSSNGNEIYCNELATTFVLGDELIAFDGDNLYIYKEDLGGYEVTCIDTMQFSGSTIKTGVNGIDTVAIGESAYNGCNSLTNIDIPATITTIGKYAFANCINLTNIKISTSVTSIDHTSFMDCAGLESISVEQGNVVYYSDDNCLIETSTNTLILGCKNSVIPDSVTSIGKYAFDGCTSLTSVMIPDSVANIGTGAFSECSNLTSIIIPDSVTSIGGTAFSNCRLLTEVTIGSGITNIYGLAFTGCDKLTNIIFTGTIAQWNAISKASNWRDYSSIAYVQCSDGQVAL